MIKENSDGGRPNLVFIFATPPHLLQLAQVQSLSKKTKSDMKNLCPGDKRVFECSRSKVSLESSNILKTVFKSTGTTKSLLERLSRRNKLGQKYTT